MSLARLVLRYLTRWCVLLFDPILSLLGHYDEVFILFVDIWNDSIVPLAKIIDNFLLSLHLLKNLVFALFLALDILFIFLHYFLQFLHLQLFQSQLIFYSVLVDYQVLDVGVYLSYIFIHHITPLFCLQTFFFLINNFLLFLTDALIEHTWTYYSIALNFNACYMLLY